MSNDTPATIATSVVGGDFEATYYDSTYQNGIRPQASAGHIHFEHYSDPSLLDEEEGALSRQSSVSSQRSDIARQHICSITGNGTDADGPFRISRGTVELATGKAYWIEELLTPNNNEGRCLVSGRFVTSLGSNNKISFLGHWKASNGATGTFATFDVETTSSGCTDSIDLKANESIATRPNVSLEDSTTEVESMELQSDSSSQDTTEREPQTKNYAFPFTFWSPVKLDF